MDNVSNFSNLSYMQIAVRALALVALVACSTAVLVQPELIGGSAPRTALAIGSIPALTHH